MASKAPEAPDRSETKAKADAQRRCGVCSVKLSTYNPGPNCWLHTIGYPWQGPTAKPKY